MSRSGVQVCRGDIDPVIEDAELCRKAAELLPPEPWDETTWGGWTVAREERRAKAAGLCFIRCAWR